MADTYTTTSILELTKPVQGYSNWHIPINANFESIDTKLGKAYQNLWNVDDITYLTTNAKYVTDHWERLSNTEGATQIKITDGYIESYYCNAGTGTITWILSNDYFGDGSDGIYSASSNVSLTGGCVKQYTTFKDNGYTITITDNMIIYATESITISGTVTLTPCGASGGTSEWVGYHSTAVFNGVGGENGNLTDGGDGGNGGLYKADPPTGGGIRGNGGDASDELETPLSMKLNKQPSISDGYILKDLYTTNWGSGGGGGGGAMSQIGYNGDIGGHGGQGGGLLILIAPSIAISGTINALGEDGYDGGDGYYAGGGGGGGGGGLVMLFYNSLSETGTINVNGGLGGTGGISTYMPIYNGIDGDNGENGSVIRISI